MKRISLYVITLLLSAACFPDQRNNFMVNDSFGIVGDGSLTEASVHTGSYTLGISKSGKGQNAASLTVNRDAAAVAAALAAYNQANNTAYKALPANLVSLDATSFSFDEKDVSRKLTLSWDAEETASYMGDDDQYVFPVLISSDDPVVKVVEGRNLLLLHLNRSSVGIKQEDVSRSISKKDVLPNGAGIQPPLQETLTFDVAISKSIRNVGLSYPVKADNSLIEAYNSANGTSYVAAPEGLVTLSGNNVQIPEGGLSGTFQLVVDYSVLLQDGTLPRFPSYLVPLTLDVPRMSATCSGDAFQLKGLSYDRQVVYIGIDWEQTVAGLSIERAWGRYSTAAASWNAYFGGTAASDRNVTMDDDYIYLAEFAAGVKKIWAIDIKNPGTVKALPTSTVESAGTSDIFLTCPRMIKNTSAAVNGGKDVLVVSNLASNQVLKMYFYLNGIDQDPKKVDFNIWADRRLGDTWTFWGTLQEGMFYLKDFNEKKALLTFKQTGSYESANPANSLQGRFVMPEHGGAAAYWPFPDNMNKGIYTVRDVDFNAHSVAFLNDSWTATGGNDGNTFVDLGASYNNCCFQFFEYKGKRYVAYATQPEENDGRLFILEGALTDSWESIVSARNVIYHAAIQNDYEGPENGQVNPSPKASTHSGLDICARPIGDDVYIVVVKQNVGLSLFHMSFTDEE